MLKFDQDPIVGNGGSYIKLADGEQVMGILQGEVKTAYVKWTEDKKKVEVEPGTEGARFTFSVNLVTMDKDLNLVPKILEHGAKMYKELKSLSEEYDLSQTIIKIKRTGSTMNNTVYSILPLPKPPSAETLKKLVTLQLLPLEQADAKAEEKEDIGF